MSKTYSTSTLQHMKKDKLIEYIRTLEYNNESLEQSLKTQSDNLAKNFVLKKQGTWKDNGDYVTTAYGSLYVYECLNCHANVVIDDYDSYCPNCGAEMTSIDW